MCPLLLCGLAAFTGCSSDISKQLIAQTNAGEYGPARVVLQERLTSDPSDRAYILDRLRLLILTLADGSPAAAEEVANQTYELLSTQGINADRTVSSAVINERVKIWKGEPFEQAMAYCYVSLQKAMIGEWDNARAAASSSLFRLKDFAENERQKSSLTTEDIARRAAEKDARRPGSGDAYLDKGYVAVKTDFALGYLLSGISNKALGRTDEARDNLREAVNLNPALWPLVQQLESRNDNTILVVDYGRGPAKVAYGLDNALARFEPRMRSDTRGLSVSLSPSPQGTPQSAAQALPQVLDVNAMAASHMWNNMEDVRKAKSILGNALLIGGSAVAIGARDDEAKLVGVGLLAAGLLLKASAKADTRHCEFLPRSVFLVPLNIESPATTVTLEPAGDPGSRMVLTDLSPPAKGQVMQLRYVRLNPVPGQVWATSGAVMYANDRRQARVSGDTLPYIMGGRCVRFPSADVMRQYHDAGNLKDLTSTELENIYREEGITFTVEDQQGQSRLHLLEGGTSLVPPLAGTAGYMRLFGQTHPPYRPVGQSLKQYMESHAGNQN